MSSCHGPSATKLTAAHRAARDAPPAQVIKATGLNYSQAILEGCPAQGGAFKARV